MTAPILDRHEVQLGTQGTSDSDWPDSVAPTVRLHGIQDITMTSLAEAQMFEELRGSLAPGFESEMIRDGAAVSMDGIALYEDVPYMLDGLFGLATSSESSNDTDFWQRDYSAPLQVYDTDLGSPSIYTIVHGDSDVYGVAGGTLVDFSLSAEDGGPTTYSANFIGDQVAGDALASLSDRAVSAIMGDHWQVFIDPSTDAVGSTEIANTAFSFNLEVNSNRELLYHLGNLTPSNYRDARWAGSLTMELELTAAMKTELDSIINASGPIKRVVRLKATSGSQILQIDFNGVVLGNQEVLTDADGVITLQLALDAEYSSTLSNWLVMESHNSVQTLP